jgi:hypothetical protein
MDVPQLPTTHRLARATLFAALIVLDGTVIGRCMRVLDNYATHKHPKVLAWLAPSALDFSLHPHFGLLAQRRRNFLFQDDPPAHPPRRLPLDRRSADRHQCLCRRTQCQSQTLRLDPIRQCYSRKTRSLPCTSCLNQCTRGRSFKVASLQAVKLSFPFRRAMVRVPLRFWARRNKR